MSDASYLAKTYLRLLRDLPDQMSLLNWDLVLAKKKVNDLEDKLLVEKTSHNQTAQNLQDALVLGQTNRGQFLGTSTLFGCYFLFTLGMFKFFDGTHFP